MAALLLFPSETLEDLMLQHSREQNFWDVALWLVTMVISDSLEGLCNNKHLGRTQCWIVSLRKTVMVSPLERPSCCAQRYEDRQPCFWT